MTIQIQQLDCIEVSPVKTAIGSVIWLHGLGADGSDFVPIVPELQLPADMPLRFIFPNAREIPITINNGYVMRAWYDIVSMNIDQRADHQGIITSVESVNRLIEKEIERGIPAEKIVVGGFSQGAVIALSTGLQYPQRLGGILALSGYLPHPEHVFTHASKTNQSIPIFLAHGTQDPVVPYILGEKVHSLLTQHSYKVNWHPYAMPHSVCSEEITDLGNWLASIFEK